MVAPAAYGTTGEPEPVLLPTLYVNVQETANLQPVSTFATPVSNLEFNPRVDLQSRNMAEAQGDVSIRGGIFENTGFQIGAATLFDPQTGHYFGEIPVAPEMLQTPVVLTGADNALAGFNSSVGTIHYGLAELVTGGSVTAGFGTNNLNFQRLHAGWSEALGASEVSTWGAEAEYSRSESDGTIDDGEHDFERFSGRLQLRGPHSQTDFVAGYQDKFFAWPNLYTPYGNESENLKTRLFLINHAQFYGDDSRLEVTGYHRRHSDFYFLDAFGGLGFEHETKVSALGVAGRHVVTPEFALNYGGQLTADTIESTSLEQGHFTSRTYLKVSLLPEYRWDLNARDSLTLRAGASFDDTNRDSSAVSPIADLTWQRAHAANHVDRLYISYAEATQVAGYTAIGGSETGGLFRSRHDLGRETSRNLELGFGLERPDWSLESAVFYRWDDDLVDWTYSDTAPFARSANHVDIETFGFEVIGTRRWGTVEAIASYGYLHKDEDYRDANVDASFYALNFPKHRVTLGLIWRPVELLEVRVDNEWRQQHPNTLREGSDSAFFTHVGISIYPPQIEGLEIFFAADNLWDDDFQAVPGTPGRSDQYTAGVTYRW